MQMDIVEYYMSIVYSCDPNLHPPANSRTPSPPSDTTITFPTNIFLIIFWYIAIVGGCLCALILNC